jgi:hypothetical protein
LPTYDFNVRSIDAAGRKRGAPVLGLAEFAIRLQLFVRGAVRDGLWTERGLARAIGVTQPHMHNVLAGARTMSPAVGDALLLHFRLTVLDFLSDLELQNLSARRYRSEDPALD